MPQQPKIDPATGESVVAGPEIDPETGESIAPKAVAKSASPAPKQSFLTQPIGEHISGYRAETEQLRKMARSPDSLSESVREASDPTQATQRRAFLKRFIAGSEADLADMLTPLFAGTAVAAPVAEGFGATAPKVEGAIARLAPRVGAAVFGAKGAVDAAESLKDNSPEGWARRLSSLSQVVAAPAALSGVGSQNREARMSSGAGLTQGEEALKAITPELDTTLKGQGKSGVKSIGEYDGLVRDTNGRLQGEWDAALKPINKTRINTQPIADAITAEITPNMLNTRDGRLMGRELWRRAREFDQPRPWTVEELDLEREKLAKSYRDAKPSDVAADLKLKARQIADRAANKAVNDMLYSMADQAAGKPPGYFKALKQKQSVLFSMADDIKAAKDTATAASAQKKGKLLREVISPRAAGHPKTGAIREAASLAAGKLVDPLSTANAKVRKAFSPAPISRAGTAVTVGAAAESTKGPAPRRHPSDEYSDPAQLQ
jgi:hypothetical protein